MRFVFLSRGDGTFYGMKVGMRTFSQYSEVEHDTCIVVFCGLGIWILNEWWTGRERKGQGRGDGDVGFGVVRVRGVGLFPK